MSREAGVDFYSDVARAKTDRRIPLPRHLWQQVDTFRIEQDLLEGEKLTTGEAIEYMLNRYLAGYAP